MRYEGPISDDAADFAAFLQQLGEGAPNQHITARFRELVAAARESGAKGDLTIKMFVEPDLAGDIVKVGVQLKTTRPEPDLRGEIFYAGADGKLHRDNPKQTNLPITRGIRPVRD